MSKYKQEPIYSLKDYKNKINLSIYDYEWEGKTEYTFEIRGQNIIHSKVGFLTSEEARTEGLNKYTEILESI